MRTWTTLLLAVLLLPAAPSLGQSDPGAPAPILEDGSGDVQAEAEGNAAGAVPAGRFAAADLKGLAIQESLTDFTFILSVAALPSTDQALEGARYEVQFAHNGVTFLVAGFRSTLPEESTFAYLYVVDPGRDWPTFIQELTPSSDAAAATFTIPVPRDLLLDADGSAPFPGRTLTGFRVVAGAFDTGGGSIGLGPAGTIPMPTTRVYDAMPNTGNGTVGWPVRLGLAQTGDAVLAAPVPVRASNGEATTMVFTVKAQNLGPQQLFRLSATGVPATWQVSLPSETIEVAEGGSVDLPILVSTPFAHEHGRLQQFTLEMAGVADPSDVGRVRLGVRYTTPPQPAGHHDTLYIHTLAPELDAVNGAFVTAFGAVFGVDANELYFNTLAPEDDEADARTPVAGTLSSLDPPSLTYVWRIPLAPGLQMGLDFDLARQGVLRFPVDTVLPMPGAVMSGRVVHTYTTAEQADCSEGCTIDDFYYGPGEHTTAATFGPTAAVDVAPNSKGTVFEAPIVATPDGDYLPFKPGATLALEVNVTFTRVDPLFGPRDTPKASGGEVVLPLLEYHDPVDQVFSSLSSLMIEVLGEQQRMVNPGKTALYELRLMNHGEFDASYDLTLDGQNLGWATILGDKRVSVPAGEERTLGIAVTAPANAADGTAADLVLAAVDVRDPTARTLARLLTTVDTEAEHPDDTSRVPGLDEQLRSKDSPMAGPALVVLALAALALARRRKL